MVAVGKGPPNISEQYDLLLCAVQDYFYKTQLGKSGFPAAFSLIFLSEIGDKTFFIAALLAAKFGRWLSFSASVRDPLPSSGWPGGCMLLSSALSHREQLPAAALSCLLLWKLHGKGFENLLLG